MPTDYTILNESDFPLKAPSGFKLVYVLLTNREARKRKAFYVGQTVSPRSRFETHRQVFWHHAKFGTSPLVYIAGLVPVEDAGKAEQALIKQLLQAGYLLTNVAVHGTPNKQNLASLTADELTEYLDTPHSGGSVLQAWRSSWAAEAPGSKEIIQPMLEQPNPSAREVANFIFQHQRHLYETTSTHLFAVAIASCHYDQRQQVMEVSQEDLARCMGTEERQLRRLIAELKRANDGKTWKVSRGYLNDKGLMTNRYTPLFLTRTTR